MVRSGLISIVLTLFLFSFVANCSASNLYVPEDQDYPDSSYSTIQAAIDASNSGDTIVIAPGTFNEDLDLRNSSVTITSTDSSDQVIVDSTIISGVSGSPTILYGNSNTDPQLNLLKGLTITGGGCPLSTTNMLGYWTFNDSESVSDMSGNGLNGDYVNGAHHTSDSYLGFVWDGSAAGSTECVSVSNAEGLETGTITMSAWVKLHVDNEWMGVFGLSSTVGSDSATYGFMYDGGAKRWLAYVRLSNGTPIVCYSDTNETPVVNTWYHIAATYDQQSLKMYVDGQLQPSPASATLPIQMGSSTGTFYIGQHANVSDYLPFRGDIDNVVIYSTPLSQQTIQDTLCSRGGAIVGDHSSVTISNCIIRDNYSMFNGGAICGIDGIIQNCLFYGNESLGFGSVLSHSDAELEFCTLSGNASAEGVFYNCHGLLENSIIWGNSPSDELVNCSERVDYSCLPTYYTGVLSHWSFDDETANDVADGNNGTINGDILVESTGVSGKALIFNSGSSNDGYITVNNSGENDLRVKTVTVSARLKLETGSQNTWMGVYGESLSNGSDTATYGLMYDGTNHQWLAYVRFSDLSTLVLNSTSSVSENTWYHVAMTYDGFYLRLYIDGNPAGSVYGSGEIDTDPTHTFDAFYIGCHPASTAGSMPFQGSIDEVAVFDRALSDTLIDKIYTDGLAAYYNVNNVSSYPLFADISNNDYHLKSEFGRWEPDMLGGAIWYFTSNQTSPCIDAGNPDSDYSNEPGVNGNRVNIGAYGNTVYASRSGVSLPSVQRCEIVRDFNSTSGYIVDGVVDHGGDDNITFIVYYGTSDGGTDSQVWDAQKSGWISPVTGDISMSQMELNPYTNYYFRIYLQNSAGITWSDVYQYETTANLPEFTNTGVSRIKAISARFSGTLESNGDIDTSISICIGEEDAGYDEDAWDKVYNLGVKPLGSFSYDITDLQQDTTYYYRYMAENAGGKKWDTVAYTFNTNAFDIVPFNEDIDYLYDTHTSPDFIRFNGSVTESNGEFPQVFVCWGKVDAGEDENSWEHVENMGTQTGDFTLDISTFELGGDIENYLFYSYRYMFRYSSGDTWDSYANVFNVACEEIFPGVLNTGFTNPTADSVTLNGVITHTGGYPQASKVEIYWGVSDGGEVVGDWNDPVIILNPSKSFSATITGLNPDALYYYRCRVYNPDTDRWAETSSQFTVVDKTPPVFDNGPWLIPPRAVSATSISMTANHATDTAEVEYYFTCVSGTENGGHDSGWQDSPVYENTGLQSGVSYSYLVQARDKSPQRNVSPSSSVASASIGTLVYVDPLKTNGDGTSWETAYSTIQEAINNTSINNSIIVVKSYREIYESDINLNGKSLILTTQHPEVKDSVVIYGDGKPVFNFNHGEGPGCVVNGFTITSTKNTSLPYDEAFVCYNSSPTIYNCTIKSSSGGLLMIVNTSDAVAMEIYNCNFIGSHEDTYNISIYNNDLMNVRFYGCHFTGPDENYLGNVLFYTRNETPCNTNLNIGLYNCLFSDIKSDFSSMSLLTINNTVINIINTVFKNNVLNNQYGRVWAMIGSKINLINSTFQNNDKIEGVSPFFYDLMNSQSVIKNCVFADNGKFSILSSCDMDQYTDISNCTFFNTNVITSRYACYGLVSVRNSIIYDNTGSTSYSQGIDMNSLYVNCCITNGGTSGIDWAGDNPTYEFGPVYSDGGGNIEVDPLFVRDYDMDGVDNYFFTADDGLLPMAPECADMGYRPINMDIYPPTPTVMEWEIAPFAIGTDKIQMKAALAEDPYEQSTVQYYFMCTTGNGHDSGWQLSAEYIDTDLQPGQDYSYVVKARDISPYYNSNSWSFAANARTYLPDEYPIDPVSLEAQAVSEDQIDLQWIDNAENETGYIVQRKETGEFYDVANLALDQISFSDSGLTSNTQYTYRVFAYNYVGNSYATNEATATTYASTSILPSAPINLMATAISGDCVELTWDQTSTNEDGFVILRKLSTEVEYGVIDTVLKDVLTYRDMTCVPLETYVYQVYAYNITGDSEGTLSSEVTIPTPQLPAAPTSLTTTVIEESIQIDWLDNATNETGFVIGRKESLETEYTIIVNVSSDIQTYLDTTILPNVEYMYQIYSFNGLGNSATLESTPVMVEINIPEMPQSVTAAIVTTSDYTKSTEVELTWNACPDVVNYNIYRETVTGFAIDPDNKVATLSSTDLNFTDTYLINSTTYYYIVTCVNSDGYESIPGSADQVSVTTLTPVDIDCPDDFDWLIEPISVSNSEITMQLTTATDLNPIMYQIEELSGNENGGITTLWQPLTEFTFTDLQPDTDYIFVARATDAYGNRTDDTESILVTTKDYDDTAPDIVIYNIWKMLPVSIDPFTVKMQAYFIEDDSGEEVEYKFEEITGHAGGSSSSWQTSREFIDKGLTANTQYEYRLSVRDASRNVTVYDTATSTVTTMADGNILKIVPLVNGKEHPDAKWSIAGDVYTSTDIVDNLTAGQTYTVEYVGDINGWIKPANFDITKEDSPEIIEEDYKYNSSAGVITVPSEGIETIQDAINLAYDEKVKDGIIYNTIILKHTNESVDGMSYDYAGEGNVNVDLRGLAITICSEDSTEGPVVIDCSANYYEAKRVPKYRRGFICKSGETDTTYIKGIEIRNGYSTYGGAIYCENSGPIIENCIFTSNQAKSGGAIYAKSKASEAYCPKIINCTFKGNQSIRLSGCGGAVYYKGSYISPTIRECTFINNEAGRGGALYIIGKENTPDISDSYFGGNYAKKYGGAFFCQTATPNLSNVAFVNNSTIQKGGAVCLWKLKNYSQGTVFLKCAFEQNKSNQYGGAIYIEKASEKNQLVLVDDCVFVENSVDETSKKHAGGAIFTKNSDLDIVYSVFNNNISSALYVYDGKYDVSIEGSVFWSENNSVMIERRNVKYDTVSISNCDIKDSKIEGNWDTENLGTSDDGGNIVLEPVFVNTNKVAGKDGEYFTEDDGYRFSYGSEISGMGIYIGQDESEIVPDPVHIFFTLEDVGNGQVKISYETPLISSSVDNTNQNDYQLFNSIAFSVSLTNGASVNALADVVSYDPVFNCYMDDAEIAGSSYALGDGNPLAGTFPASSFSINMAYLDDSGHLYMAPDSTTDLVTLQLHGTSGTTATVTISNDELRSAFQSRGVLTNLPVQIDVQIP